MGARPASTSLDHVLQMVQRAWIHSIVGDFLRYAPVSYAQLCALDREPYLQPACKSSLTLNDSTSTKLLEQLAGRTLLFNGDSISVEHWMATACALLPGATDHSRLTLGGLAPQSKSSSKAMCVSLRRGQLDATRVCYSRLGPEQLRIMCDDLTSTDVIIANWGIQYHTSSGKVSMALANVTAETIRALTDKQSQRARPFVIWRERAPQHFPGSSGHYGGDKVWWSKTRQNCTPISRPDTSYNDLVSPMVRAAGIPILPVWKPSLPHHHAHFSWKPLGGHDVLDCTHYCLASGLLDHWVELLMVQLQQSLSLNLSVAPLASSHIAYIR